MLINNLQEKPMIKREDFNYFSTYLLAKEAENRGAKIIKIFPKRKLSYILMKLRNKTETIVGQRISKISVNAFFICKNKQATKYFLNLNKIKTTEGEFFYGEQKKEAIDFAKKIGFPVVVKPLDGTHGKDVFLGIKNIKELDNLIEKAFKSKKRFMVEKQFKGNEYRILATREKLLGVINRVPANVVGDGKHTIKDLVTIKNKDPRRMSGHMSSLVKINIDEEILKNLKESKLKLTSILSKGRVVFLRKNSNISTGGDSIDFTEKIHPKIRKLAPKIISSIPDLSYGGIDFLTPDITKDPEKVGYAVIEINDSPMISMHHIPYEGKERNVAKDIIDLIF